VGGQAIAFGVKKLDNRKPVVWLNAQVGISKIGFHHLFSLMAFTIWAYPFHASRISYCKPFVLSKPASHK
jgi:hypothetical protein